MTIQSGQPLNLPSGKLLRRILCDRLDSNTISGYVHLMRTRGKKFRAVVVGSGPNGLGAAIRLAQGGLSVIIYEASHRAGGGMCSESLTLPGFIHDVCSTAHPLAAASPFFRSLPLESHGLKWIHSPAVVAHPLDDGTSVILKRSVEETAQLLGADGKNYRAFFEPLVKRWRDLMDDILRPIPHLPKHPLLLAKFGLNALLSAQGLARRRFREERARTLFAGIAAHASVPLTEMASAAPGLVLQIAGHAVGWPIPAGGSQKLADALVSYFKSLGGEIILNTPIRTIKDFAPAEMTFFDLSPGQILKIVDQDLPPKIRNAFSSYKHGPGVFKLDWALSAPIPWTAKQCREAATVHLGGTLNSLVASESGLREGKTSEFPYVLLCQPSLFDPTRAPRGNHTAWAYCHVPHHSTIDMTDVIENQIERFAPGFKGIVLKRSALTPLDLEKRNPNLIGGDISGGLVTPRRLLIKPAGIFDPYTIKNTPYYICSASTPPGPGVHGMCGFHAATRALKRSGGAADRIQEFADGI